MFEHLNQSQRSEFVKWSGQDKIEEITSNDARWACGVFFDFSLANPRTHLFQLTTCDFLPAAHFFPPVQVELFDNHEVLNAHYMGCTFKHRSILEPARISNFLRQSVISLKLRILFQNSSPIFTFRPYVNKRDIPPYLHYMTFYTTQSIYFLKVYDQTRSLFHHFLVTSSSLLYHFFTSYSSIAH